MAQNRFTQRRIIRSAAIRICAHAFHAGGDAHVDDAAGYCGRDLLDGEEAGGAKAVDDGGGGARGEAGGEDGGASHVGGGGAEDVTDGDVLDEGGVDGGGFFDGLGGVSVKGVGRTEMQVVRAA